MYLRSLATEHPPHAILVLCGSSGGQGQRLLQRIVGVPCSEHAPPPHLPAFLDGGVKASHGVNLPVRQVDCHQRMQNEGGHNRGLEGGMPDTSGQ